LPGIVNQYIFNDTRIYFPGIPLARVVGRYAGGSRGMPGYMNKKIPANELPG